MNPDSIRQFLADGEGLTIEYKECANGLNNSVWETVCSFSNRYGGHLIIGVEDNGTPVGVNPHSVQQIKKNFVNILNNPQKTSPSLFLSLEEVIFDGVLLLYVYVPVSSQIQSCSGRIYDRNEDGDFDITNSADLKIYSGGEPELIEGDVFKTIIPLKPDANGSETLSGDLRTCTTQDGTQDKRLSMLLEYSTVPRSRDEMQRHYGISTREYFRKNVLKPLLESGQLKMTIPDKPNSRNQRYVKA